MKNNIFTSIEPCNYSAQDDLKHLYFKDYKQLQGVSFETDSEPLADKIIGSIALVSVLLLLLFI